MTRPTEILKAYDQLQSRLPTLVAETERKLNSVLAESDLSIHSISNRIKTRDSLKRKIARPDRTYSRLDDVTDVVGFRVVTYFEDSIEKIGQLIEKHFTVDFKNSTNKLRALDHERFGYRSMHYVCVDRGPEKFHFEIQIRTVLQHAWAEIEHDLGYKAEDGIPGVIRRRFSQVASILEIADREFVSIRKDVSDYQAALKNRGVENNGETALDLVSLAALLAHQNVRSVDEKISKQLNLSHAEADFYPAYLLKALNAAEIYNVGEAFRAIEKHGERLESFVLSYFKFAADALGLDVASIDSIHRGYALLFIAHLEMLELDALAIDKTNRAAKFYERLDFQDSPAEAVRVGRTLIDTLQAARFFGEN